MCKLLAGFGTSWVGNLHTVNIEGQFHQKNLGTGQTPPHPPLFDNARIEKATCQNILPLLTRPDLGPIRRNKQVIIRWWKPSFFRANNDRPVNQSNIAKVNLSSIFFAEYNNHVSYPSKLGDWPDWIHHKELPPARPFDFCTSTFSKSKSEHQTRYCGFMFTTKPK